MMSRLKVLLTEGWSELEDLSRPAGRGEARTERTSSLAVAAHTFRVGAGVALRRTRKLAFRDEWFVATRPRTPYRLGPSRCWEGDSNLC